MGRVAAVEVFQIMLLVCRLITPARAPVSSFFTGLDALPSALRRWWPSGTGGADCGAGHGWRVAAAGATAETRNGIAARKSIAERGARLGAHTSALFVCFLPDGRVPPPDAARPEPDRSGVEDVHLHIPPGLFCAVTCRVLGASSCLGGCCATRWPSCQWRRRQPSNLSTTPSPSIFSHS